MHMILRVVVLASLVTWANAQETSLKLMSLFSDHMVLPRGETTMVKGRARPSAEVQLRASWLKQPVTVAAGSDGSFSLPLPAPTGDGPFTFEAMCGEERVAVHDVLCGDVWLASGQSNMEMTVGPSPTGPKGTVEWAKECAASEVPTFRMFTVRRRVSMQPQWDVEGSWSVCSKESARAFSATAFFFGRDLALRGKGPIGVVASSWGGTVCEAWTRAEGLSEFREFDAALALVRAKAQDARSPQERRAMFWSAVDRIATVPNAAESRAVALPHVWSRDGMGAHDGIGVYSREVAVSSEWAGRELLAQLGPIDDMESVLWDGQRIGGVLEMGRWADPRSYRISARLVTAGAHRLTVAIVDASGEGGVGGSAESCRIGPVEGGLGSLSLAEGWSFRQGPSLRDLPPLPEDAQQNPNVPSVLWNGMIAPLVPFPFTGAIWYQGESNRDRAAQYAQLFPAMIRDWRKVFGREMAFLFVQIAPFGYANDKGQTFELRLAQEAALALPAVGMAVTTDIGDPRDIHPLQKRLVGERLAEQARWIRYGEPKEGLLPPRVVSAKREGSEVALSFEGVASWRTDGSAPVAFELAGADGAFRAATARIDGARILVSCEKLDRPQIVRYAGAATAMANLWNDRDLPLPPFAVGVSP